MNWLDIFCLTILVAMALMGLYRGFLRSIFRVVAWIIGIAGAYCSHLFLSDFVIENFDVSPIMVKPICLVIGFVVPFALAQLAGYFLHSAVSHSIVSKPNRILGALFGAIKASIILFVILTVVHFIPLKEGSLYEMRSTAVSYDIYLSSLEYMGYPTERKVFFKKAEKKAKALTKGITEKASEKAKEGAEEIADKAKEAAENAAENVANKAKDAAVDAAGKAIDKVSDKVTEKKDSAAKATDKLSEKKHSAAEVVKSVKGK